MIKILSLLLASAILSGCSQFQTAKDSDIQPGQFFVLKQPIEILPDQTRRFIQKGLLTTRAQFERREQHCRIEVRSLKNTPQTIQPDRFEVTRVRFDSEPIARNESSVMLASNVRFGVGFSIGIPMSFNDDGPSETMELVEFELTSDKQPDVMRLVCAGALSDGHPIDFPDNQRPNAEQIKRILGEIGYFE